MIIDLLVLCNVSYKIISKLIAKGYTTTKLDIEKAYDRFGEGFIKKCFANLDIF